METCIKHDFCLPTKVMLGRDCFMLLFFRYKNRGSMNSSTRTLTRAFGTISGMSDRLNLPGIITDRAKKLFKMVHEGKNLKGHSSEVISSACLYIGKIYICLSL